MTPEQTLHEAIEGGQGSNKLGTEQHRLVRLAWGVRRIEVAGPGAAALDRMTARFDRFLIADPSPAWQTWLAGWLGQGGVPRPVVQRLAAAGLLVGAMGFGGAAATGTSPEQVVTGIASFAANAVENLTPRSGGGGDSGSDSEPTETPTDPPTPSPTTGGKPIPTVSAGASVAGTPPGTETPPGNGVPASGTTRPSPSATVTPTPETSAGTLIPPTSAEPPASPTVEDGDEADGSPTAGSSTTPTGTPGTSPTAAQTATTTATAGGGFTTQSYSAGQAGNVVLRYSATTIEVVSVAPTAGWTYDVSDVEDLSLKVEFEGNDQKIVFRATLQNGAPVTSFAQDDGEEESGD